MRAIIILAFFLLPFLSKAQEESPRKKFFLEFNSGYSYLLDSRDSGYYSIGGPTTYDHYSNFGCLGLAIYFSPKKKVESKSADFSIGLGFNEWIYTVRREYFSYHPWGGHASSQGTQAITKSNIFTIYRSQVNLHFLWAFENQRKLKFNFKTTLCCLMPKTSSEKKLDFRSYSYFYPTASGYDDTIHTTDAYIEKLGFGLTFSTPFTYAIKKNTVFFIEPGLTFSGMRMDYKVFKSGIYGMGIFTDLKLGLRYHF